MTSYITAQFAAILGLLMIVLAMNVSRIRIKEKVSLGDGGIKPLIGAMRAHGNAFESIPIIIILLFFYETQGGNPQVIWTIGVVYTISRFLHAWGMIGHNFLLRRLSAAINYLVAIILPLLILF